MRTREGCVLLLYMDWQEWQQSWQPLIDHIWVLVLDLCRYVINLHSFILINAQGSYSSVSQIET
jgi:hypothetical protein